MDHVGAHLLHVLNVLQTSHVHFSFSSSGGANNDATISDDFCLLHTHGVVHRKLGNIDDVLVTIGALFYVANGRAPTLVLAQNIGNLRN